MNKSNRNDAIRALAVVMLTLALSGCATSPPPCGTPSTKHLVTAVVQVEHELDSGCAAHFDRYFDHLLTVAEGDPKPENKRIFSDHLLWATDRGILSQRQAKDYYNRFFNVKFVSLESDYNNCSHTCPRRDRVMRSMERELSEKERGLLRISLDNPGYYRADELFQEVELVLEATCTACEAAR